MNRCSISEEETTNAVLSLNLITDPAPAALESRNNQDMYLGVALSGVFQVDQSHPDLGVKQIHGPKDVCNAPNLDDSTAFPNSKKKNRVTTSESTSLNGEKRSTSLNEAEFLHLSQSSDLVGEKYRVTKKDKNKLRANNTGKSNVSIHIVLPSQIPHAFYSSTLLLNSKCPQVIPRARR